MGDARPPAVLLGGENTAVSAARSLRRIGVEVYGLGDSYDPVRYSNACDHFADVGSKEGVEQRYMEWLERGPRGAVVLPCYDDGLETIARNRTVLEGWGYRTVEANDEVVLAMIDKERTYQLASAAGIEAPQIVPLRREEDAEAVARDLRFPLALKPTVSHLFARHYGETKLLVVEDRAQLEEGFSETRVRGIEMLAIELIPGPDDAIYTYYTYLDEHGEPLYHFTKRKLRQWPVHFGLACYQHTTWDPDVAEVGLRFCQAVGIRGIGTVEFKRDARDGRLVLIECNPRLTGSNELVRNCGLEVAQVAYQRLVGASIPPIRGYRKFVHEWYPVEDLRAMLAYRDAGELRLVSWARSLLRRQHFPMLCGEDPMPSIAFFAHRVRRFATKQARRLLDSRG
jgi:D-aspartate ligase